MKEGCNFNKLSLSAAKTNLLFIGTSYQTNHIDEKDSFILQARVTEAKFLGITLDSNLSCFRT